MRSIKGILFFIVAVALNISLALTFGLSIGLIFYHHTCYLQDDVLNSNLIGRLFSWIAPVVIILGFIILFLITNKNQKKLCILDWILILNFIFVVFPLIMIFGVHGCAL